MRSDQRAAPALDRKIVTSWNGLALSAFAQGFRATGREDLRRRAVAVADYLLRVHVGDGGDLARASNGGVVTFGPDQVVPCTEPPAVVE